MDNESIQGLSNATESPPASLASLELKRQIEDFSRWRLDTEDICTNFEHDLKGEYWNPDLQTWVKGGERLLNDEGVKAIISFVRVVANKSTILSYLTKEDINRMCMDLNFNLIDLMLFRYKEFEVKKEHLSITVSVVMNFIFATLKRAEDGGERKSLTISEKVLRSIGIDEKKSGGGLRSLLPFGRGKE